MNVPRTLLEAKASRFGDDKFVLSLEGTRVQNQVLSLLQVSSTLRRNGGFHGYVQDFLQDLSIKGHAELRQPLPAIRLQCLG